MLAPGYKVGESDLESVDGRMRVLELLIAELQAARIGVFTMEPHKLVHCRFLPPLHSTRLSHGGSSGQESEGGERCQLY